LEKPFRATDTGGRTEVTEIRLAQIEHTDTGSELVGLRGTPFVLMVDGAKCHSGAFWTHLSSFATREPVFMVDTLKEFLPATTVNPAPQGRFQIELGYPSRPPTHAEDVRDCPSLKKALVEMGKLRKGC
jgi:hypothetical protein